MAISQKERLIVVNRLICPTLGRRKQKRRHEKKTTVRFQRACKISWFLMLDFKAVFIWECTKERGEGEKRIGAEMGAL